MPPIVLESLLTAMWLLFLTILLVIIVAQAVVFVRFLLVATVALQVYVEGKDGERFYWWPLRHRDRPHPADRPKRADEHASARPAPSQPAARPAPRVQDDRPVTPAPAVAVDRPSRPEPAPAATTPVEAAEEQVPDVKRKPARESRTSSLLSGPAPTRAESPRPERAARAPRATAAEPAEEGESEADREAAMNRLFAPLSETDSTEPLSAARLKRAESRSTPPEG